MIIIFTSSFFSGGSVAQNTERLRGYSIRVSNTSDVFPGNSTDVCFTHDSSPMSQTIIQEDCKRTTRYIWFYQPHGRDSRNSAPILEICEVEIFGKTKGFNTPLTAIV